jgi:Tfp pilus assembly protein PilO
MASSSALADFARKPPAFKAAVFAGIAIVLAGLYYQLIYAGLRKDVQAAEDGARALVADERRLTADEKEYEQLTEKQAVLERIIAENDSALPTAAQLPAFFDMLNRKIGEAGVEVRRWDYLSEIPVEETIAKVPVQIELQGSFYQLKKFFHLLYKMNEPGRAAGAAPDAVEERDRIVTIEDLRLGDPLVRNNELILRATFRASTFRKEAPEVEEPAAEPRKGARSERAPAPAGVTGAPERARGQAEDALQQSENRAAGAERVKGGL